MALSNIGKEPRREITESAFGLGLLGALCGLDWWACSLTFPMYSDEFWTGLWIIPVLFVVGLVFVAALLAFTHWLGEEICGWLQDQGLDPRPRLRRR